MERLAYRAAKTRVAGSLSACALGVVVACSSTSPEHVQTTRSAVSTVGCYADSSNRDLPYLAYDNGSNTTETCISTCASAGYAYAGTQYGSQCFCGNSYGGQGTSNNCNMPCSGNGSETCGGSWANDVYATGRTGGDGGGTGSAAVTAAPSSVAQGGAETITVSNSDGGNADWVGLYAVGEPNTDATQTWLYLNGTQQRPSSGVYNATLSFTIPAGLAPGQYEWRLEFDNGSSGYSLGAASPPITVTSQSGGGVVPVGIAPPAGMQWQVTFDDEFMQDSSIRTDFFNGGTGNVPWCGGDCSFNGHYPGLNCGEYIFGTPEENNPCGQHFDGVSVSAANGLSLQPWQDYNNLPPDEYTGYVNHTEGASAAVNTYGKFSQKFGYFEWSAKYPHDQNGEGDGLHPDIWARTVDQPEQEVDVAETVIGTQNTTYIAYGGVHDCCGDGSNGMMSVNADISAAWHVYGLYWANDGSGTYGSMTFYVDGVKQSSYTLDSAGSWADGIYFYLSMDPGQGYGAWGGGNNAGPQTSNSDPLLIQYMRAWQLVSN